MRPVIINRMVLFSSHLCALPNEVERGYEPRSDEYDRRANY